MTTISINLDNFKRFSKRLQKEQSKLGFEQTLSQSQEMLARTLGFSNFFEFQNKINEDVAKPSNNIYEEYLTRLKSILDREDSSIRKCFFTTHSHNEKIIMEIHSKNDYAIGLDFNQLTKNLFKITKKYFDYEDVYAIQQLNDEFFNQTSNGRFWILDELGFKTPNNDIHYYTTEVPFISNALFIQARKMFKNLNGNALLKIELDENEKIIDGKYYRTYYAEIQKNGILSPGNGMRGYERLNDIFDIKECNHGARDKKYKKCFINMFDRQDIIETDEIY